MEEVQTKLNVVFTLYFFLMLLTKTIDQQPLLGFVRASPVGQVFPQRRDDVPQRRDGAARVLDDGVRGRAARLVRHATPPVWLHHTESGQTLQGSFSAVSKQASKQAGTFGPSQKRKETQVYLRATKMHLT